jgi:hypothetical protein
VPASGACAVVSSGRGEVTGLDCDSSTGCCFAFSLNFLNMPSLGLPLGGSGSWVAVVGICDTLMVVVGAGGGAGGGVSTMVVGESAIISSWAWSQDCQRFLTIEELGLILRVSKEWQ